MLVLLNFHLYQHKHFLYIFNDLPVNPLRTFGATDTVYLTGQGANTTWKLSWGHYYYTCVHFCVHMLMKDVD